MADEYRWIDDPWWRDWVFWVGIVVATVNLVGGLIRSNDLLWWLPVQVLIAFGFTVAVLGFIRTAMRSYRAP